MRGEGKELGRGRMWRPRRGRVGEKGGMGGKGKGRPSGFVSPPRKYFLATPLLCLIHEIIYFGVLYVWFSVALHFRSVYNRGSRNVQWWLVLKGNVNGPDLRSKCCHTGPHFASIIYAVHHYAGTVLEVRVVFVLVCCKFVAVVPGVGGIHPSWNRGTMTAHYSQFQSVSVSTRKPEISERSRDANARVTFLPCVSFAKRGAVIVLVLAVHPSIRLQGAKQEVVGENCEFAYTALHKYVYAISSCG